MAAIAVPHAMTRDWKVKRLAIQGNKTFKTRDLKTLLELRRTRIFKATQFSASKLRSDISALERFYRSQGFFAVDISERIVRDSSRYRVAVDLKIDEGVRTCVNTIQISSKRSVLDNSILGKLKSKPGKPLLLNVIDIDADYLKSTLANEGFLKATVKPELTVDSMKQNAVVTYMIDEGPLVSVDTIKLSGNKHVHSKVLIRELGFSIGDTLTLKKIRKAEQQLYRTNLFNFVHIESIVGDTTDSINATSFPDSSYPVNVTVQQADFFRIEGGLGYGTAERLRASLQTSYANVFQIGHSLTFKGKYSQVIQGAEVIYGIPWFLGLPLQFNSSVYLNRKDDYDKTYYGVFHGIILSAGRTTNCNLAYQLKLNWEEVDSISAKYDSLMPELPTKSIGASISYDTRNDLINPSRGIFNSLETEVSGLMGNASQFFSITNDFRFYWKTGQVVFGTGFKAGWVRAWGESMMIPPQQRFYTGGARSIRGFSENLLKVETAEQDANYMFTANLIDVRFPLFWWFKGAAFVDAGNVWESVAHKNVFKDLRWTAGPGIRLNTPIAVVRFDVGFKLNKKHGESTYEMHFDLGQPF